METLEVRVCFHEKADLDDIIFEIIRQKLVPCTFLSLDIKDYVEHMDKDFKKRRIIDEKTKILEKLQEIKKEYLSLNKELIKLQEDINAIS